MRRLITSILLLVTLLVPASVSAYSPLGNACTSGTNTASACSNTSGASDPIGGTNGLLKKASLIVASIAGIAAVIIIIISGIQFATSGGDPQKAARARTTLIGAIIGLVIIVVAQGILVFVLSKL
jgi:hypothetical protein